MMNNNIQVVIADDNNFFCEALKDSLNLEKELNVKATFTDLNVLIDYTSQYNLDVLILDVNFNGINSLEYIHKIRKNISAFKIIALTTLNNNYIEQQAIENGIDCFVGKDADLSNFKNQILNCFYNKNKHSATTSKKIIIDNLIFTKRKLEILQAIYEHSNMTEKEIAQLLNISESALKTHKRELFEITNTNSTPELLKFGIQKGLIIA
ncbi:MAG: response regulator transcription factor [Flavobacteriaceae bacterium]|nr:response regulator transcription factor [Flavobacteriaceae bacterium]